MCGVSDVFSRRLSLGRLFLACQCRERSGSPGNSQEAIVCLRVGSPAEDTTMIKFPLGHVVITPGCLAAFEASGDTPQILLLRHATENGGNLFPADKQANEEALRIDARL